jgi:hypothetical protein
MITGIFDRYWFVNNISEKKEWGDEEEQKSRDRIGL